MALTRIQIATSVENISLVTSQRALVNQSIGIALDRVYQWYDWPYYMNSYDGVVNVVPNYTTGTVTTVAGSATVTLNAPGAINTLWATSGYYKIRIGNDKPYYRIIGTGVGTLTLNAPYPTAVTASGYSIYKDEYALNADVDKYKVLRQMKNGVPLIDLTPTTFDRILPAPQNLADPIYNVMEGTLLESYTTGLVWGTAGSQTITGVGTSWLSVEGLGRMSRIRVASNVYTIESVDSDTQITVFDIIPNIGSLATPVAYEILLNNPMLQVYFIPNASEQLYYRYFRQPTPLVNDWDTPDMPWEFHWLLIYGALSFIYLQKGDINKAQIEAETRFLDGLNMMKMKLGTFAPDRIVRRKTCDSLRRRRFEGVENSNFDWKYSAY